MRNAPSILITLVMAASLYLDGNGRVALWDRDEPRYAQTSRQMVDSGDWVVPMLLDTPRIKKPAFIYWCQASAMKVLGTTDFAARLPSVIGMLATLALMGSAVTRGAGKLRSRWTVFMLATAGLSVAAAKMCLTDAVLLFFITLSQLALYQLWRGRWTWGVAVAMGLGIGFAGLTKGPVVLGVGAMTVVILYGMTLADRWKARRDDRNIREDASGVAEAFASSRTHRVVIDYRSPEAPRPNYLHRAAFVILMIVLAALVLAPWLYLIEQRIPGYTLGTLKSEVVDRAQKAQEGHTGPPGYYLLLVWVTWFPWSLLLPAALVSGWKNRKLPQIRFALAAVIGPWILFEIVKTKLPHYILPTYPFLAFLTADMLVRASRGSIPDLTNRGFIRVARTWGGSVMIVAAAVWLGVLVVKPDALTIVSMIAVTIVGVAMGLIVSRSFGQRRPATAAIAMGFGMLFFVLAMYALYLPRAEFLRLSPRVASILREHGATTKGDVIMIDYKETSLAFYQGGTIRPEPRDNYLNEVPPEQWPTWMVVTDTVWKKVPDELRARVEIVGREKGIAYADEGRSVELLVLRKR